MSSADTPRSGTMLVCGGAVVDCIVRPFDASQCGASRTSMPGEARISLGGVGRNIAEVSSRLGCKVALISAVGNDEPGRQLLNSCRSLGIGFDGVAQITSERSASYTALLDGGGELVGAVADMAIFDKIGPDVITGGVQPYFAKGSQNVRLLICDANLGTPALEAALRSAVAAGVPAWFEPVSIAKSVRGRLPIPWYLATPNWEELQALLGHEAKPLPKPLAPDQLHPEIYQMLDEALCASAPLAQNLFLSLGPLGCVLASKPEADSSAKNPSGFRLEIDVAGLVAASSPATVSSALPPLAVEMKVINSGSASSCLLWYRLLKPLEKVRDVTGAGDALLAGTASAFAAGWQLDEAVLAGLLAAHLTLFADGAVAPTLSPTLLQKLHTIAFPKKHSRL
eukprot:TRINITY_DN11790_c0_g1_i1.p1 TRINITY_DN11790_c0_g1~~TRINITY_DN11790_c0_g1_i1.p1  ORF type:complete len:397 (+),score=85.56 TRINITY_DN11790_c0_g1_i1:79-1269(+)